MPTKKRRVSHSNEYRNKFDKLAERLGKSLTETFDWLIEHSDTVEPSLEVATPELEQYSVSEQKEIYDAVKNSGLTISAIVREGTLQRARYLNSIAENQAKLESMSADDVKNATFKGVSRHRISMAVEKIREHNDQQTEKKNKVCITRGIVFKITGSNRSNINKFFDEYEVMISDHNHKHELTDSDNRKGKGFDYHELLGIA